MSVDTSKLVWTLPDTDLVEHIKKLPDGTPLGELPFVVQLKLERDGAPRDPNRVWQIFNQVAGGEGVSTWMAGMCRVHINDARRRDPDNNVRPMLVQLQDVVTDVVRSPHAGVLEWLLAGEALYNVGLCLRMLKQYGASSAAQQRAVQFYMAAGNPGKAALSNFVAGVEGASAALVHGDPLEIDDALAHLAQVWQIIQRTVDPIPDWFGEAGGGNRVLHTGWAQFMAGALPYSGWSEDGNAIMRLAMPPRQPNHWTRLFGAIELFLAEEWNGVKERATTALIELVTVKSSSIANVLLTFRYLLAMAYFKLGRTSEARDELLKIMRWDGYDGGVPMAVARRTYQKLF